MPYVCACACVCVRAYARTCAHMHMRAHVLLRSGYDGYVVTTLRCKGLRVTGRVTIGLPSLEAGGYSCNKCNLPLVAQGWFQAAKDPFGGYPEGWFGGNPGVW